MTALASIATSPRLRLARAPEEQPRAGRRARPEEPPPAQLIGCQSLLSTTGTTRPYIALRLPARWCPGTARRYIAAAKLFH
ncbi:MAG TPA: hypothetical protein VE780_01785 [Thermoleophilaceae bacterium]|jgi:hypothetical protein|nr:hypothetical protein [Thermoleophilaceae bacterium]